MTNTVNKQSRQETIIYIIVWVILFISPIVGLGAQHLAHPEWPFFWRDLFRAWVMLGVFLLAFIIHNHVLAPWFLRGRFKQYIFGTLVLVAVFQFYQCTREPMDMPPPEHRMMYHRNDGDPIHQHQFQTPPPDTRDHKPGPPLDSHAIVAFIVLLMMLATNLGVKLYFRALKERDRVRQIKEQGLKQELEYLRYQMNPHFFMNTLNNIHALVDIDPTQAKDSIVSLSKMMRYLLYEADKGFVPLTRGMEFLNKYVELMRMRYTDKVTINLNLPDHQEATGIMVPSLVFIPFVENAFKHGVSYNKPSLIDITTTVDTDRQRVIFSCRNTKNSVEYEYGGVGLTNMRKRLDIIYGNDYNINIEDKDDTYHVTLDIPIRHENNALTTNDNTPQQQ